MLERPVETESLHRLDGPVERDPRHHFRMREVAARTADLPDSFVGIVPVDGKVVEHGTLQLPGAFTRRQPRSACQVQRVHHLAIHVELELHRRGVAGAHRRCAAVAGKPAEFDLLQTALAGHAVQDLHVGRAARHRAQQPFPPLDRFIGVARQQQRIEREGGVAQPAVAVVPVAHAATCFGQRGRGRSDDAAGLCEGQRLERDQRTHDAGLASAHGRCSGPTTRASRPSCRAAPVLPRPATVPCRASAW